MVARRLRHSGFLPPLPRALSVAITTMRGRGADGSPRPGPLPNWAPKIANSVVALARVLVSLGLTQAKPWLDDRSTTHVALFALAACAWQIPLEAAAMAFLFAWLEAQVARPCRLVPLGQTDGQRILADSLRSSVTRSARGSRAPMPTSRAAFWATRSASAQHETQYSRLFRP